MGTTGVKLRLLGAGLTLALATWVSGARAQVSDATAAEALAAAGAELLAKGDSEGACRLYRESSRLEQSAPRLLALATCWERIGKSASAWEAYRRAGELASLGQADYAAAASEGEERLAATLTRIQIDAPKDAAFADIEVSLDGARFVSALYGVPVPVDPGLHRITATAPGRQRWSLELTLPAASGTTAIGVPLLPPSERATRVAPLSAEPTGDALLPVERRADRSNDPGKNQRTVGLVIGGAGVLGLGAGVAFGLKALSAREKLEEQCAVQGACTESALASIDESRTYATASNVALGLGAASVAAGIIVYLLAPSAKPKRVASLRVLPLVDERSGGIAAFGRF
jgi:hypothetical protein